jgi:IS5 family transposase
MKAHTGVDSWTKLIHAVAASPANVRDSLALPHLLHRNEIRVWGDSAYTGQGDVIGEGAPMAKDFTLTNGHSDHALTGEQRARYRNRSRLRAKVEHDFGVIKCVLGSTKVRYRGIAKNAHRVVVARALANLFMVRRLLLRRQRE